MAVIAAPSSTWNDPAQGYPVAGKVIATLMVPGVIVLNSVIPGPSSASLQNQSQSYAV